MIVNVPVKMAAKIRWQLMVAVLVNVTARTASAPPKVPLDVFAQMIPVLFVKLVARQSGRTVAVSVLRTHVEYLQHVLVEGQVPNVSSHTVDVKPVLDMAAVYLPRAPVLPSVSAVQDGQVRIKSPIYSLCTLFAISISSSY